MDEEISRREFMQVGTTSLLALQTGGNELQVERQQPRDQYEFQGVADLIGPLDARPAPGGDFFDNKKYYWYRYEASDTGERFFINQDDSRWTNISIMQKYETTFGFPAVRNSTNRVDAPASYDFNTTRHRLVINGAVQQDASSAKFTDGDSKFQINASGGDTIAFGVRELTRYVPNYELMWGCASWAGSALTTGQTARVEFTDSASENGYRYRFEPNNWYVEQLSQGNVVSQKSRDADWEVDPRDMGMDITTPFVSRDYLSWYGAGNSRFTFSFADGDDEMQNPTLDTTSNKDDIATRGINNRVKVVVDLDAGAADLDWNIGSFGTLIQGQATEFDRIRIGTHYDLGGAISQFPTDNVPVLALRIDPNRANTAVELPTPVFAPTTNAMELTVYGVFPGDTDADFLDVDGDGVNEGPVYSSQTQAQNDVIQWTRNVSTFPTASGQRMDNTSGQVVDGRQIGTAVSPGGRKNQPAVQSGSGLNDVKKNLYPGEVALFIPRTLPQSTVTDGSIDYIQSYAEEDW